jgi:hypothetical protein
MVTPGQAPHRQAITKEFFQFVTDNADEYELFLSPVNVGELNRAKTVEKRQATAAFLETIQYTDLPKNMEAENLALVYSADGVLSQANIDDLRHVAYAVIARCDYVVSWNMKHLANARTEIRVNRVNANENYAKITIVTPEHFTNGGAYAE